MAKMPSISSDQFEYLWQNLSDDSGNIDDLSTEFDLDQLDDTDHEVSVTLYSYRDNRAWAIVHIASPYCK